MNLSRRVPHCRDPSDTDRREAPILTSSLCRETTMREPMILHNKGSSTLMKADHITYSFRPAWS
jgi:hypothetical protein